MEAVRASAAWVASRSSHVTVDLQGNSVPMRAVAFCPVLNLWYAE
jgi:hypothetical protein